MPVSAIVCRQINVSATNVSFFVVLLEKIFLDFLMQHSLVIHFAKERQCNLQLKRFNLSLTMHPFIHQGPDS